MRGIGLRLRRRNSVARCVKADPCIFILKLDLLELRLGRDPVLSQRVKTIVICFGKVERGFRLFDTTPGDFNIDIRRLGLPDNRVRLA